MRSKTDRVICGTCEYWTGERNPVFDRQGKPKVDILDEIAFCQHPYFETPREKRKDQKCAHHSKWTELL